MRRSPRLSASLIRSIYVGGLSFGGLLVGGPISSGAVTGGALAITAVTASTVLVGCEDENKPEYWLGKLDDKKWQPQAIKRLKQFFEDGMGRSGNDITKPEMKELLDKLADPLTKLYVDEYQNLDEKTREALINLLASLRDKRTEPALIKAFEEFGKRGRGGRDVKWAARAVRDMNIKSASAAVFAAFKATKPSTKEGAYFRDLNEALLAVPDPAWVGDLNAMLVEDFPVPKPGDVEAMKEMRDKAYRVITAAQILGELGEASAVPGLLKVILDPTKNDAANEALLALTKIGKPAVDAAVKLLKNEDPALAEFHKKQIQKVSGADKPPEGNPHVARAAIILGTIGRKEAIEPLIAVISADKDNGEKAQLLGALAMLPHTPEVKTAFLEGFKSLPKDAAIGGGSAIQALAEPATSFFDSSFVPALLEKAAELKDDPVAQSLLGLAATKIMDETQVVEVEKLIKALPTDKEGPLKTHLAKVVGGFEHAKKVMETCKKDAACYLTEAKKIENHGDKSQMAAVKALYMVGMLKGPEAGKDMLALLGDLEKGELRYVAAQVMDHHSPTGSKELADGLQAIVDKNKDSVDTDKAAADKPLRDGMYRLRARAQ